MLGVDGNVMICHGGSDLETIANVVKVIEKYLKIDLNERLRGDMIKCGKV